MGTVFFKGKLLKLSTQQKQLPTGQSTTVEVIEHPGAVLIIPFLSHHEIVLIHQYRPVLGKYLYELPAGTLNPHETILRCAHRELQEETGYKAKIIKKLGHIYPVPGYSTEVISIFQAEQLTALSKPVKKDLDEVIETKVLTKQQISQLFKKGKINDAKTICALAFCRVLNF